MQDKVNTIPFSMNTTSNILVTDNTVNLEVIGMALVAGRNLETFLAVNCGESFHFEMYFSSGANLGPPGKPHQLEDSYSPYNMMSSSESPTSPLVPQDSWGQGKSSNEKMANGTNINWPPGKSP